ncbi:superoxide dismutase [Methylacidiphilum caldifontis]|uniref:Superoxide dismutase n=1 Tax=Methylacidiphilum caldifontis TaxID=2795386 RepID=A0A4Y8PDJ2_9BACT|nr:Fe-Mn family superoxide dismutase [Methylacidiphilum caldifontis]QSR88069.1 Fe-Mn family superoxide dismutase [Methylacidiphilum caldifontis]TFE69604.1 superoxide dismutase [Methylacidiphilum caldifontis]
MAEHLSLKLIVDQSDTFLKKFESGIGKLSSKTLANHVSLYKNLLEEANTLAKEYTQYMGRWLSSAPAEELSKNENIISNIGEWFSLYGRIASHELYFNCLRKNGSCEGKIKELIEANFGSIQNFKLDIKLKALHASGWVWTVLDHYSGKIFNIPANREDAFPFSGMSTLIAIDLAEHAYEPDFGQDKEGYIEEFFNVIDWEEIEKNLPIM